MFPTNKTWFNPVNIISEFKRLEKEGKLTPAAKDYKKIKEAYISAVSLVGLHALLKINFWLQIVDDKEGSPDVKTINFDPKGSSNDFNIEDVEIVTFGKYSSDDIVEFLIRTKLSDKKGYDNLTTVLCFVDKFVVLPTVTELNKILLDKNLNKDFPVLLLGKVYQDKEIYRLVQIYPLTTLDTTFDLFEESRKITYAGRLQLGNKGKKREKPFYINDGTKIEPFVQFGLK